MNDHINIQNDSIDTNILNTSEPDKSTDDDEVSSGILTFTKKSGSFF